MIYLLDFYTAWSFIICFHMKNAGLSPSTYPEVSFHESKFSFISLSWTTINSLRSLLLSQRIKINIGIQNFSACTLCCTDTATLKWTRYADTWQILKNTHDTVSDTHVGHVSDMTPRHDRSVHYIACTYGRLRKCIACKCLEDRKDQVAMYNSTFF